MCKPAAIRTLQPGRHEHKFGLDWNEAKRLYLAHRDSKWIRWRGISAHIGSQITTLVPFRRLWRGWLDLPESCGAAQINLRYLDVGGGLGVRYCDQKAADTEGVRAAGLTNSAQT